MSLPLEQIKVLDLSRVLAGPYCTMLLGDLGAQIIKIERPGHGDDTRQWGPPFVGGESAYFLCCNRNKKSVTLDLKSEPGRAIATALAARCDVLVENFLPGSLDDLGLGYETLKAVNPRLVYCSITGFGQDGPYRDLPGYDLLIQALGGVMSITGEPEGAPMKVGVAIADINAGLFAANAILAALVARATRDVGERIDIALFDATVAWLANVGEGYLVTGDVPQRYGNAHPSIVPYQAFRGADEYFVVAIGNDGQWERFCLAIERPDFAVHPRFRTNPLRVENRAVLVPLLEQILATRSAADWLARFASAGVPSGPVNTIDRVFDDPQVRARHMLLEVDHAGAGRLRLAGSPLKLASMAEVAHAPPPMLGQHTDEVLSRELGYDGAKIDALRAAGAI
jgi:formyl-CoA transferase